MPLYKAKITITQTVEIPVYEEDEESANAYMIGTDEWKEDGLLCDFDKSAISFTGTIDKVTDPKQVDFDGEDLCWCNIYDIGINVAEAFYEDDSILFDANGERTNSVRYEVEDRVKQFDDARKAS